MKTQRVTERLTQRAAHARKTLPQDMGVDLGGAQVGMTKQILNRADIVAAL